MENRAVVDLKTGVIVDSDDPVEKGREAWIRIKGSGKKLREDWLITATALDVGRQECTTESGGLNKKLFGQWCAENGFSDMHFTERSNALWLLDNWDSIIGNPYITFNQPNDIRKQHRKLLKQEQKETDKQRKSANLKTQDLSAEIRAGDFVKVLSDLSDIGLILTDPPYGKDALPLWEDLAVFASEKLAEDGVLIAYSGQMYLPEVMNILSDHLEYWWTFAVFHQGSGNLTPLGHPVRKVINQWKPILFYMRNGGNFEDVFRDVVPSELPDKTKHNWAQPVSEARWIIDNFSFAGDLVVDPFSGGGTVAEACVDSERKFIGAEILKDG